MAEKPKTSIPIVHVNISLITVCPSVVLDSNHVVTHMMAARDLHGR